MNKFLIFAFFILSGCNSSGLPLSESSLAQIPQEFTEPVPQLDTVDNLRRGLDNPELYIAHGNLREAYGVCQRRHSGLASAIGLRDSIQFSGVD